MFLSIIGAKSIPTKRLKKLPVSERYYDKRSDLEISCTSLNMRGVKNDE